MIAIIVNDDGHQFSVMTQAEDGKLVNITGQYQINPMAIEADGKTVIGFHIGYIKPEEEEPVEQVLGSGNGDKPKRTRRFGRE